MTFIKMNEIPQTDPFADFAQLQIFEAEAKKVRVDNSDKVNIAGLLLTREEYEKFLEQHPELA